MANELLCICMYKFETMFTKPITESGVKLMYFSSTDNIAIGDLVSSQYFLWY